MKKLLYVLLILAIFSCKDKDKDGVKPGDDKPVNNIIQLTNHTSNIGTIYISPDGNTIYYTIDKNQQTSQNRAIDLYSIKADGTGQKLIFTYPDATSLRPIVSEDNQQLALSITKMTTSGIYSELVVGDINASSFKSLHTYNSPLSPKAFTKDGKSIIYSKQWQSSTTASNTIWKLRTDSTSNVMISPLNVNSALKDISVDRNLIAVDTYGGAYTMDLNGQNIVQVGPTGPSCIGCSLNPVSISSLNSSTVLFKNVAHSSTSNALQIFVADVTGTNVNQITQDTASDNFPVGFFPAGDEILFQLTNGNAPFPHTESELYSIKPDGSGLKRLTNNNYEEVPIGFLEKKKRILFPSNKDGFRNLYVLKLE